MIHKVLPQCHYQKNANHAPQSHSILCSDFAIKRIDEPFITANDNPDEWAV